MSTLKSSAEDLTLNADGSGNDIIFQSNGSNVATLDQAGLLTATTFAGSGASLTALPAANITGTLPAISGANLTGVGISEADQWRLNTAVALADNSNTFITANLARSTQNGFDKIGTGVSESSGVFTFPSTGYWLIHYDCRMGGQHSARYLRGHIYTTTDDGTYVEATQSESSQYRDSSTWYTTVHTMLLFDVTNVSTHKVKFSGHAVRSGMEIFNDGTHLTFIKLGDT